MRKVTTNFTLDPYLVDEFMAKHRGNCSNIVEQLIRNYLDAPKEEELIEKNFHIIKITEKVKPKEEEGEKVICLSCGKPLTKHVKENMPYLYNKKLCYKCYNTNDVEIIRPRR